MAAIMKHDMKAILGEDFFKEEVRSDYLISAEMKRVFTVLIDLYITFSEICEQHGLRYYAFSGMLLGAIRHNGIIPWDDDLDVAMPRDDYNKLMEIVPKELEYPYFLRTPYTDPDCYYSSIALMNLSTAFIPKMFINKPFKKGILLDIFPIDNCDPETFDDDRERIYDHIMRCGSWMKRGCENLDEIQLSKIAKYPTNDPLKEWEAINIIASNPKYAHSKFCAVSVHTIAPRNHAIYPTSCFEKVIDHPFESITIKIPAGYDALLKVIYGDYNTFPPISERGKKNEQIIFDPDNSYLNYCKL